MVWVGGGGGTETNTGLLVRHFTGFNLLNLLMVNLRRAIFLLCPFITVQLGCTLDYIISKTKPSGVYAEVFPIIFIKKR